MHPDKTSSHILPVTIRAQRVSSVGRLMVGMGSGGDDPALLSEHPSHGVIRVPCPHQTSMSAGSTMAAATTSAGTQWAASSAAARRATSCSSTRGTAKVRGSGTPAPCPTRGHPLSLPSSVPQPSHGCCWRSAGLVTRSSLLSSGPRTSFRGLVLDLGSGLELSALICRAGLPSQLRSRAGDFWTLLAAESKPAIRQMPGEILRPYSGLG